MTSAELASASADQPRRSPGTSVCRYIKFHPTLAPALAGRLEEGQRAALEERFRRAYHELASYLYQSDNKTPIQARAIAARELPNLRRALDLHLAAGDLDAAVELADSIAKFLDVFGRWRERDGVMEKVREVRDQRSEVRRRGVEQGGVPAGEPARGRRCWGRGGRGRRRRCFGGCWRASRRARPTTLAIDRCADAGTPGPQPGGAGPGGGGGGGLPAGAGQPGRAGAERRRAAADRRGPHRPGGRAGRPGALRRGAGGV